MAPGLSQKRNHDRDRAGKYRTDRRLSRSVRGCGPAKAERPGLSAFLRSCSSRRLASGLDQPCDRGSVWPGDVVRVGQRIRLVVLEVAQDQGVVELPEEGFRSREVPASERP